jgi:hypothetical protein
MRFIIAAISVLLLVACAATPQSDELLHGDGQSLFFEPTTLAAVPFFPQLDHQCGPAALATILVASGVAVTPDELVARVYLPAREGSLQAEMLAASRTYGRISYLLDPSLVSVLKEVRQGRPVLVMQNLGVSWYQQWHYAVVVGYDIQQNKLLLRSGTIRDYEMSLPLFERTWQRSERWAMVVLAPGELPVDADETAALKLWKQTGVRVLPGSYLAQDVNGENPGKKYIRVALVAPKEETERGLEAIRDCLYAD